MEEIVNRSYIADSVRRLSNEYDPDHARRVSQSIKGAICDLQHYRRIIREVGRQHDKRGREHDTGERAIELYQTVLREGPPGSFSQPL